MNEWKKNWQKRQSRNANHPSSKDAISGLNAQTRSIMKARTNEPSTTARIRLNRDPSTSVVIISKYLKGKIEFLVNTRPVHNILKIGMSEKRLFNVQRIEQNQIKRYCERSSHFTRFLHYRRLRISCRILNCT